MIKNPSVLATVCLSVLCGSLYGADGPLPPKTAAASIKLPEGFTATLFAGEPDVVQPMSITFDDRGRMWVVECRSYPKWLPDGTKEGKDRILILEDTDGDGQFDQKKIFIDNAVNFSSVEYGFGGVFVVAIPNLLFIPDANADDIPDGPAKVLINGFDLTARHNAANSLVWGPDGWLYGCNGILSNSKLGKPGTPDNQRIPMNCGIWRYHPVKQEFEVVAHGTTNPWGLAFDERGEAFLTNCVIEHAFHVVPGSRFKRMFGQDFNPRTFELMQTCADHIHWAGGTWEGSRNATGKHGEAGGGHAHAGAMIYLGEQFPADFRNCLFTLNIHGQRLNRDKLERNGSGYIAKHLPDFAPSGDPWFRGVCVRQGPDGAIYFTDWSDTGECHNYEEATIHRDNGRIYKVKYGTAATKSRDLSKLNDAELIEVLGGRDGIQSGLARRNLQERASAGKLASKTSEQIATRFGQLAQASKGTSALQYLWTLHTTGDLPKLLPSLWENADRLDDTIRGWLVRLEFENKLLPASLARFEKLARNDSSSYVRLQLASGLQRLPVADRLGIAQQLVTHAEDSTDNNQTLLLWYGIEPLIGQDDATALSIAASAKIPKLRQFIARHLATGDSPRFAAFLRWVEERHDDTATLRDILSGFHAGIEGRRDLKPEAGWAKIAPRIAMNADAKVRDLGYRISLIQGNDDAFNHFASLVKNVKLPAAERERALGDLVTTRRPVVADLLLEQLDDSAMRDSAIRGLAGFDRAEVADRLLNRYSTFNDSEKQDAIATLTAREKTALPLVRAVEAGKIDKRDLSEFDIRQLQRFKTPDLKKLIDHIFGAKPSTEERAKQIAEMKQQILADNSIHASAGRGRAIFNKNCSSCHILFGEGRQVGPDLTGAQRTDLDYVLINVMDPSALVGHAYRVTVVELKDGRMVNGIVKSEDAHMIALQTATDRVVVSRSDIESSQVQPVSMMPEGLLNRLTIKEVRDLVKYLGSPDQVPAE